MRTRALWAFAFAAAALAVVSLISISRGDGVADPTSLGPSRSAPVERADDLHEINRLRDEVRRLRACAADERAEVARLQSEVSSLELKQLDPAKSAHALSAVTAEHDSTGGPIASDVEQVYERLGWWKGKKTLKQLKAERAMQLQMQRVSLIAGRFSLRGDEQIYMAAMFVRDVEAVHCVTLGNSALDAFWPVYRAWYERDQQLKQRVAMRPDQTGRSLQEAVYDNYLDYRSDASRVLPWKIYSRIFEDSK